MRNFKHKTLFIIFAVITVLAIIGYFASFVIINGYNAKVRAGYSNAESGWITKKMVVAEESAQKHIVYQDDEYIQAIRSYFEVFNNQCFGNSVDYCEIQITDLRNYKAKGCWAVTNFNKGNTVIVFERDFVMQCDWPLIASVLMHEMVHAYIYQNSINEDKEHGVVFHKYFRHAIENYERLNNIQSARIENAIAFNVERMYSVMYK